MTSGRGTWVPATNIGSVVQLVDQKTRFDTYKMTSGRVTNPSASQILLFRISVSWRQNWDLAPNMSFEWATHSSTSQTQFVFVYRVLNIINYIWPPKMSFGRGHPLEYYKQTFFLNSFISALIEILTSTGHPKGLSTRVLAKNVFFRFLISDRGIDTWNDFRKRPRREY